MVVVGQGSCGEDEPAVTQAISRLTSEFAGYVRPTTVGHVVLDCRRELQGAPVRALPELVERLARQRLLGPTGLPAPAEHSARR
jgi:hypothetical protein